MKKLIALFAFIAMIGMTTVSCEKETSTEVQTETLARIGNKISGDYSADASNTQEVEDMLNEVFSVYPISSDRIIRSHVDNGNRIVNVWQLIEQPDLNPARWVNTFSDMNSALGFCNGLPAYVCWEAYSGDDGAGGTASFVEWWSC